MFKHLRNSSCVLFIVVALVASGCDAPVNIEPQFETRERFTLLNADSSGLYFVNELKESEAINVLTYEYLYNGGGVAIGDINNDSLPDIFMVGNLFGGRLFLNQGNMKFRQISDSANVYYNGFSTGVTMVDINTDGFLDIYICRSLTNKVSERSNLLLVNNGNLTFTERAAEYGLNDKGYSNHANFFDYDLDGDLDMYLINHRVDLDNVLNVLNDYDKNRSTGFDDSTIYYSSNRLYRNNGSGKFEDVTTEAGVGEFAFSLSATVSDINNDGYPDIYLACDYYDKDRLYINDRNGGFKDSLSSYLGHISRNSMGCDIADFNNDGLLDIMNLDMMAEDNYRQKQLKGNTTYDLYHTAVKNGYSNQVMRNTLQVNNGNGTFSEIGQFAGVSHTDWSWAPLFADFNNDGMKDLFISNGYYRDVTDMDFLKFESPSEGTSLNDANRFALVNKMKSVTVQNYFFVNNGDLTFTNTAKSDGLSQLGHSNGAAYADLDRDGDLDLVVNNLNAPSFFYRNNTVEQSDSVQWITIVLKGDQKNASATGARVWVFSGETMQCAEVSGNRGFFSYMVPELNFGLQPGSVVDSVVVRWPNGTVKMINGLAVNHIHHLTMTDGNRSSVPKFSAAGKGELKNESSLMSFTHEEGDFIDFKNDPLLEFMYSAKGPYITQGDINGDELEDVVIAGAAGEATVTYVQESSGAYRLLNQPDFEADRSFEDGQLQLLDVDGDKDLDLFVISSDNELLGPAKRQHRLYINEGKGKFTRDKDALPVNEEYAYAVRSIDVESDGDADLIVGGYIRQGSYPNSDPSYILVNDHGKFNRSTIVSETEVSGMVNDICVADINGDKMDDIVLAGEWMPIRVFLNGKSGFAEATSTLGLGATSGLWNCVTSFDADADGDVDLVAGNRGTNTFFRPRNNLPAKLYYKDFDANGKIDPIPCYPFADGQFYPKHTMDILFTELPSVRRFFPRYSDYSASTATHLITMLGDSSAPFLSAEMFETALFTNDGQFFSVKPLPVEAQFTPIYSIAVCDYNGDSAPDLVMGGNSTHCDIDNGRCDAGYGSIFSNTGKAEFKALAAAKSGLLVTGEIRWCGVLNNARNGQLLCIARNAASLLLYSTNKESITP